ANLRLSEANSGTYKTFIGRVREELGSETYRLYGIPVLKHSL
nr:Chain A, LECTIN [Trichosanthes anguina]5Y42_A Chain A, Lectin [Trichosanthes anguina]5Y42_D Chain D, Lectin [Trichosanthes anguina]5Y97_A Chain A, Seed lectin [Trichosanthes anguina]